jgi:hypothetical protein
MLTIMNGSFVSIAPLTDEFQIFVRNRMTNQKEYSKRTLLMARAFFAVIGCIIGGIGFYAWFASSATVSVLSSGLAAFGVLILVFGMFSSGYTCARVSYWFLNLFGL